MAAATAASATGAKPRVVAESALELLTAEVVRHYKRVGEGAVPPALLQAIGTRVGRALAERYTRDRPRLMEHLDVIKWACKELWNEVFRKQVDSLRTNHRGTFVLKDNHFRWTRAISTDPVDGGTPAAHPPAAEVAQDYLLLPCAIVRGALQALGVECTVSADAANLPAVDFTIVISSPQPR